VCELLAYRLLLAVEESDLVMEVLFDSSDLGVLCVGAEVDVEMGGVGVTVTGGKACT